MNPLSDSLEAATQLYQQRQYVESKQICRQLLQQQPDHIDTLLLMGIIACQTAQFEESIACFQRVLKLKPNDTNTLNNLGNVFRAQGKFEEAIAYYQRALTLNPYHVDAHFNLGIAFQDQGETQSAIASYEKTIALKPSYINAYINLGSVLRQQGRVEEAIELYKQALVLTPDFAEGYDNLGCALREAGALEEAVYCHERAIALKPTALAYYNLGNAWLDQGDVEKAIRAYNRAIALEPTYHEARLAKATSYLLAGDLMTGFAEYEARWGDERTNPYDFDRPLWNGSPLQGRRILLVSEQDLGDTLQFIRYAAMVAHLGGEVIVRCEESLLRLLATVPGVRQVVPEEAPLPAFDVYLPMMSLPRVLKTRLEAIPASVPYVQPPAQPPVVLPQDRSLKIGLVWNEGDTVRIQSASRCCPLIAFQRLLRLPNSRFYSLQSGDAAQELVQLGWRSQIQDLSEQINDFADTAAIAHQLDLIITVDTDMAHLAGALAKPVWVLLPYASHWRWMGDRPDSPWYPTMRLFRQRYPGDWSGAIEQVAAALQSLSIQQITLP